MPINCENKIPLRILCVYATRQIDSNLFMSGTLFNGLKKCGYEVDVVFMGPRGVLDIFKDKYGHYFRHVFEVVISEGWLKRYLHSEWVKVLYSFYLHFLKDGFIRPYRRGQLPNLRGHDYRCVLSFVPPPMSGLFAHDLVSMNHLHHIPLIQFWTDPLSLGRCNDINEIPIWRCFHKMLEHRILSYADRAVYCFPLLCEMEQRLHPEFAQKMTWSDVSYVEHPFDNGKPHNQQITIGLFGAYQRRVRNIEPLLTSLRSFPKVKFIIRGDSDVEINPSDYPNLDILPGRLPSAEVEQLETQCDILLSLGGLAGVTHPAGKTFYYVNYDKPIVYIGDGVHRDYFAEYLNGFEGRFIICNNTVESIVEGINNAIAILPHFSLRIPARLEPKAIVRRLLENL